MREIVYMSGGINGEFNSLVSLCDNISSYCSINFISLACFILGRYSSDVANSRQFI